MPGVLRLHPYQSHLHHGEAQCRQTPPACPGVVQLMWLPWCHSSQGQTRADGRQPGGHPLLGCQAVNDNGHPIEVVLCFGGPAGDPGCMTQTKLPPDHQGVSWVLAAAVRVVVLQGLEVTARVEGVGAGEELGAWPNFTSEQRGVKIEKMK